MSVRSSLRPQVLAARQRLSEGRQRLRAEHDEGRGGLEVCARLTDLLDAVVLDLFEAAWAELDSDVAAALRPHVALATLGGQGRREVAPYSDVDLSLLVASHVAHRAAPLVKRFLQDLYDTGLDVGYSVRTPNEAITAALNDPTVFTSLVDVRHLAGDEALVARLQNDLRGEAQRNWRRLFTAIEQARLEERARYGETVYLLEPNVKRSRGGLRGLQMVRWLGLARYGIADPAELQRIGALSAQDQETILRAREFLLRLRNELHFHAQAAHDVLDRAEQVRLAKRYGYPGQDGLLPVEQFMRQYIQVTQEVRYLTANFVASVRPYPRMAQLLAPMFTRQVQRDYRVGPMQISATPRGLERLRGDLAEVIRLTDLAGAYDKRISHATWTAVRDSVSQWSAADVTTDACRRLLSLLSHSTERLGEMLRRLLELGALEKLIPAFRHARCLLQFNDYHKYTVDEHCIRAVECATALARYPGTIGNVYNRIKKKSLLHLALLIHDLGKGFPEDHSDVGRVIAGETAARLGLSADETATLQFLVYRHLFMSHMALRRDTSDPQLAVQLAVEVGSPEVLDMLYVLTAADLAAVGPGVLNDWKIELLTELYERAMHHLGGGEPAASLAHRLEERRQQVRDALARLAERRPPAKPTAPVDVAAWCERQLAELPAGYLAGAPPQQIAEELLRVAGLPPGGVATWARYLPERRVVQYTIGTFEDVVPGIFHRLTGALTSQGLRILSAEINTLTDGVVLDRFYCEDPDHASAPPPDRLDRVCRALEQALVEPSDAPPKFRRVWQTASPGAASVSALPTRVHIDNSTSERMTIIDVFTHDRMGLLYTITRRLFELGSSVALAKIGTYLDQVVDVFYVTDAHGRKIEDEPRLAAIRQSLLEAIDGQ